MIVKFSLVRITPTCCLMFSKHADIFCNANPLLIPSFYKPKFLTLHNLNYLINYNKTVHSSHNKRNELAFKSYEEYCNLGVLLEQATDYRFKFAPGDHNSFAIYRLPSVIEPSMTL